MRAQITRRNEEAAKSGALKKGQKPAASPTARLGEIADMSKVHDYLTICAPTPFQAAGLAALSLPDSYYEAQRVAYAKRRKILLDALSAAGLAFTPPEGAYYVMADGVSAA